MPPIRWFTFFACLILLAPAVSPAQPATSPDQRLALRRSPVVEVFEHNRQSVVNISSTRIVQVQSRAGFDSLLEELFDLPRQDRTRQYTSVGSGFVLHEAGYIVTNAHVVARTAERQVIFSDGGSHEAQIVAMDEQLDLAVLKIETDKPLKPVELGTSSDLMVGETVIAIGNPLGYEHTVTAGVVSALGRTLQVSDQLSFEGLVQTDASINPGNSGGPLMNILGELVGINTAIRADAQNIGFAIPVDQLRDNLPSLLDVERRYRFVIGMQVVSSEQAPGVSVTAVNSDSPAGHAAVQPGDRIIAIDGKPIRNAIDYHISLIGRQAGEPMSLTVQCHQQPIDVQLTPAVRPRPDGGALLADKFGLNAQPLDAQMARAMRMSNVRGLLVTDVEPTSPADGVGIRRGDVIIQIGRHPVFDLSDVGELLETLPAGRQVQLRVLRLAGRVIYRATVSLEAR